MQNNNKQILGHREGARWKGARRLRYNLYKFSHSLVWPDPGETWPPCSVKARVVVGVVSLHGSGLCATTTTVLLLTHVSTGEAVDSERRRPSRLHTRAPHISPIRAFTRKTHFTTHNIEASGRWFVRKSLFSFSLVRRTAAGDLCRTVHSIPPRRLSQLSLFFSAAAPLQHPCVFAYARKFRNTHATESSVFILLHALYSIF